MSTSFPCMGLYLSQILSNKLAVLSILCDTNWDALYYCQLHEFKTSRYWYLFFIRVIDTILGKGTKNCMFPISEWLYLDCSVYSFCIRCSQTTLFYGFWKPWGYSLHCTTGVIVYSICSSYKNNRKHLLLDIRCSTRRHLALILRINWHIEFGVVHIAHHMLPVLFWTWNMIAVGRFDHSQCFMSQIEILKQCTRFQSRTLPSLLGQWAQLQ